VTKYPTPTLAPNGRPTPTREQLAAALTRLHLRYRKDGADRWRKAMNEIQYAHWHFYGCNVGDEWGKEC
jgi:hypothetical protein